MTRNVGSRASCYPPDSVSFRRFAGARADCGLPRANVDIARGAALPFGSLALASGNTRSRAGVPTASNTLWQGIARYDRKAAPTRATLQQSTPESDRSRRPKFSIIRRRKVARSRSIERNNFAIFHLGNFDRTTIAKRPGQPRVPAVSWTRSIDLLPVLLAYHSPLFLPRIDEIT